VGQNKKFGSSQGLNLLRYSTLTGPHCTQLHSQSIEGLAILWWCMQLYMHASCNNIVPWAKSNSFAGWLTGLDFDAYFTRL